MSRAASVWTREPPTEPGWYWALLHQGEAIEATEVYFDHSEPRAWTRAYDDHIHASDFDYWGPRIEPPPAPDVEDAQ